MHYFITVAYNTVALYTGCILQVWWCMILYFLIKLACNEAFWTYDLQSAIERHHNSSGTKEVQQGWTNSSFKSPPLAADESVEQSCRKRYLGSHHWLERAHILHLWGALSLWQMWQAHITLMPGEDPFEVLPSWECWWGLRKNISSLRGFSFINSRPVGKEVQHFGKGLLRLMCWRASPCPVFTSLGPLNFLMCQMKHLPLWCFLARPCSLAPRGC